MSKAILGGQTATLASNSTHEDPEDLMIMKDGNYATATCLASKRPHAVGAQKDFLDDSAGAFYRHALLDDGHGEPIHEPIWSDEGWVTPLMREQYMWRRGLHG